MFGAENVVIGDLVAEQRGSMVRGGDDDDVADKMRVRVVTSEEVRCITLTKSVTHQGIRNQDLAMFSIADVVLPLPGYAVVYPEAEPINRAAYTSALNTAGVASLDLLENKGQKVYSLSGGYRCVYRRQNLMLLKLMSINNSRFLEIPGKVQHKLVRYNKVEPLLADPNDVSSVASEADGAHTALVLGFTLGSGSYATMAIRELCRPE